MIATLRRRIPSPARRVARAIEWRGLAAFFALVDGLTPSGRPPYSVSEAEGSPDLWRRHRWGILRLQYQAFASQMRLAPLRSLYSDPAYVFVLFRDATGRLFAVAYARQSHRSVTTAYLASICLDRRLRRKGYAGRVLDALELAMLRRGYQFADFDAVLTGGWADALERRHRGHIIEKRDHVSEFGPQRYLFVRLVERRVRQHR